jgi:transcriptional regulator with XRE-family HTH domain
MPPSPATPDDTALAVAFGARLRGFRESRRMTQEKLGQAAGIASSTISHIENGRRGNVSLSRIMRLAAALGCQPGALTNGLPVPTGDE